MLKKIFLDYLQLERGYSPKTILSYGTDIAEFEVFFHQIDTDLTFQTVDTDIVRQWAAALMEEKTKATSINRKLSALRSFYKFLLRKGEIEISPMQKVKGPKKEKALPYFVREEEMNRLLDDVDYGTGWTASRDRLIIEMFYETGMRRAELVGLDDADVDFYQLQVKVTGKRNKQRYIPFGNELKEALQDYLQQRNQAIPQTTGALFVKKTGERITIPMVYTIVKNNLSKVVTIKKRSPHVLRHTFATTMLNHQAELGAVKDLLGHQSIVTTEIYTHTTFEELKNVYKHAHPRGD